MMFPSQTNMFSTSSSIILHLIPISPELGRALEHFHVALSDVELDLLWQHFSNPNGFDFIAFESAMFPDEL